MDPRNRYPPTFTQPFLVLISYYNHLTALYAMMGPLVAEAGIDVS